MKQVKDTFIVDYDVQNSPGAPAYTTMKVMMYKTYAGKFYIDTQSVNGIIEITEDEANELLSN